MSDDIEVRAREQGWVPQDEYRGNPKAWRTAEEFLERGETVLPIIKSQNRRLEADLARVQAENQRLAKLFGASQESIVELQAFHEQNLKDRLAQQKRELAAELAQAREDGDVHAEVDIQTRIAALGKEAPEAKPAPQADPTPTPTPQVDPALQSWMQANPWFGTDARRTKEAMGVAQLLEADPANEGLTGAAFYSRVSEELARRHTPGGGYAKVGGGRPSGEGGGGGGGGGSGFDSLPPEAKEACRSRERKMVGEGRAFKDTASWQQYYAKVYFDAEAKQRGGV